MSRKLHILIPPSEGKEAGGLYPPLKKAPGNSKKIIEQLIHFDGSFLLANDAKLS